MTLTDETADAILEIRETTATALDEQVAERIELMAREVEAERVTGLEQAVRGYLPDRGVQPGLHYLLARLAARRGASEESREILGRVIERLNQNQRYGALVLLLDRAGELLEVEQSVPLLVRAYRETGGAAVSLELIAEWADRHPEDPRLDWLQGLARAALGEGAAAAACFARALVYLVREAEPIDLEEAALPVLESIDAESAPPVTAMIAELVGGGRFDEALTYLELCLDPLLDAGQAGDLWECLRPALVAQPEAAAPLRPAALDALRRLHAGQPRFAEIVDASGLADVTRPIAAALEVYERIVRLPPGGYVEHTSWGIGEVLEHDGDTVVIRFASRPMHEMQRALAERVLERRDADDLRVLAALFPERLAALRDGDPGALVAAALKSLGGEGKPRDLRRLLTAAAIDTADWPGWWRQARATLEDDLRFDLSQTFRDLYRLAEVNERGVAGGDLPLPRLSDRDDPVRQLRMLRRFEAQHPFARQRLIRLHTRRLERWLDQRRLTVAQRLLVRIVLADWHPDDRETLAAEAVQACRDGFDLSELTVPADQELLLDLGLAESGWEAVAIAGLGSRLPAIRARARSAIEERSSRAEADRLYHAVLEASPERGDAVLEAVSLALEESSPVLGELSNVHLFLSLLALVSEPERDALRNRALKLLDPTGPVFARLRSSAPERADIDRVAVGLLSYRASDRFLNPILDSLEQAWGPAALEALRRRRRQESARIAARMDDDSGFPTVVYMSRATHTALAAEIERLQLELRTSIPRAIRTAREHGDLRENAEYDAAKLRQQQANDRLQMLVARLDQAAIIEEASPDGSEVFVGTEVWLRLPQTDELIYYWILGYDDSAHGDGVVSFQTEIGRALWRRRVGDEIELPGADGARAARVERIEVKMPEIEAWPAS